MEVYVAAETADSDEDDDRDHLAELNEILERPNGTDSDEFGEEVYQQLRFDLCPECRKKFVKNPMPREAAAQFDFSEN